MDGLKKWVGNVNANDGKLKMSKKLKISTIRRIMEKNSFNFSQAGNTAHFFHTPNGYYNTGGLVVSFPPIGNVKASARWKNGSNVHIDSYFFYPSKLVDLDIIIKRVKEIYKELCNATWNE